MQFRKIEWKRGMEITPSTFECQDRYHQTRVETAWRLLSCMGFGSMPGYEIKSSITGDSISLEVFNLQALTKSGKVISISHFSGSVKCSDFNSDRCYVVIGSTEEEHLSYNGVGLLCEKYKMAACSLSEIDENDFPIAKIINTFGSYSFENDYVLPSLTIGSSRVLLSLLGNIWKSLDRITEALRMKDNVVFPISIQLLFLEKNDILLSTTPETVYRYLKKIVTALSLMLPVPTTISRSFGSLNYNNYDFGLFVAQIVSYLYDYEQEINKLQEPEKVEPDTGKKAFIIHV